MVSWAKIRKCSESSWEVSCSIVRSKLNLSPRIRICRFIALIRSFWTQDAIHLKLGCLSHRANFRLMITSLRSYHSWLKCVLPESSLNTGLKRKGSSEWSRMLHSIIPLWWIDLLTGLLFHRSSCLLLIFLSICLNWKISPLRNILIQRVTMSPYLKRGTPLNSQSRERRLQIWIITARWATLQLANTLDCKTDIAFSLQPKLSKGGWER